MRNILPNCYTNLKNMNTIRKETWIWKFWISEKMERQKHVQTHKKITPNCESTSRRRQEYASKQFIQLLYIQIILLIHGRPFSLWYHVYGSSWTAKIIQTNNLIITPEAGLTPREPSVSYGFYYITEIYYNYKTLHCCLPTSSLTSLVCGIVNTF